MISDAEFRQLVRRGNIAIFVEGSEEEKDAFYYNEWFRKSPQRLVFLSANGWQQVKQIVAQKRIEYHPEIPIYGILDRDFTEDLSLDADFTQGLLRLRRYTLENYFLNPECWMNVLTFTFRQYGKVPDGWSTIQQIQDRIERIYRECLPFAAYNSVVNYGNNKYARFLNLGQKAYASHPRSIKNTSAMELKEWGEKLNAEEDFGEKFTQTLTTLKLKDLAFWETMVSGKYVWKMFYEEFPIVSPKIKKLHEDQYLNQFMDKCSDPPEDLRALVDRIRADATI